MKSVLIATSGVATTVTVLNADSRAIVPANPFNQGDALDQGQADFMAAEIGGYCIVESGLCVLMNAFG
jgi:hypothetical protein